MAGAHHALTGADTLAHAGQIDRQRRRMLEDACAGCFRELRQAERIVEGMVVEGAVLMQRVEMARIDEILSYTRSRPQLNIGADPTQPLDCAGQLRTIVGL